MVYRALFHGPRASGNFLNGPTKSTMYIKYLQECNKQFFYSTCHQFSKMSNCRFGGENLNYASSHPTVKKQVRGSKSTLFDSVPWTILSNDVIVGPKISARYLVTEHNNNAILSLVFFTSQTQQ